MYLARGASGHIVRDHFDMIVHRGIEVAPQQHLAHTAPCASVRACSSILCPDHNTPCPLYALTTPRPDHSTPCPVYTLLTLRPVQSTPCPLYALTTLCPDHSTPCPHCGMRACRLYVHACVCVRGVFARVCVFVCVTCARVRARAWRVCTRVCACRACVRAMPSVYVRACVQSVHLRARAGIPLTHPPLTHPQCPSVH